jgi:hypothetical protein
MASQIVQMDYARVTAVSNRFKTSSARLIAVGKVLGVTITMLRVAAFFGVVLAAALAKYFERIKLRVDYMAAMTAEFSRDLARAVDDHRNGQYVAGSYFGEGLTNSNPG